MRLRTWVTPRGNHILAVRSDPMKGMAILVFALVWLVAMIALIWILPMLSIILLGVGLAFFLPAMSRRKKRAP